MARHLPLVAHLALLVATRGVLAQAPDAVAAGEVRAADLVVMGHKASVDGTLTGTVVAVFGDVSVTGRVEKDVIALGGDIVLGPGAVVGGDLLAVGGTVSSPANRRVVVGRVLTVGALEAAFAAELRTSPLAMRPVSGLLLAFRILLLFLWLVIGLLLLRFVPRPVAGVAGLVPGRLATVAAVGLAAVLSAFLISAFLLLVLPAMAGLLVTGLLVALLGAFKAFGLAAVFIAVGRRLTRDVVRGSPFFGDPAALALGLALLGLASLVPLAGPVVWSVASLLGIGATLVAFSRRDARAPGF